MLTVFLDQLFSEEQFEVYRSLGFHMAHGFLSGDDDVCVDTVPPAGEPEMKKLKFNDASNPTLATVYAALFPASA